MGRRRGYWWAPGWPDVLAGGQGRQLCREALVHQRPGQPRPGTAAPSPTRWPGRRTRMSPHGSSGSTEHGRRRNGTSRNSHPGPRTGRSTVLRLSCWCSPRDQRQAMHVLACDPVTGATETVSKATDPAWLEIVPGVPLWLAGQQLVGLPILRGHPPSDNRRQAGDSSRPAGPGGCGTPTTVCSSTVQRTNRLNSICGRCPRTATPAAHRQSWCAPWPGQHRRWRSDGGLLDVPGPLRHPDRGFAGRTYPDIEITSRAAVPAITPSVRLLRAGQRELRCALVLPTGYVPGSQRLPVLMDPYGGPQIRRVVAARNAYLEPQWWADNGFAVLIVDGRGGLGRGWLGRRRSAVRSGRCPSRTRSRLSTPSRAATTTLTLARWRFVAGRLVGYLAAAAVLRRPDVFHAAVAGAPATDQRLYDTHHQDAIRARRTTPRSTRPTHSFDDAPNLRRPLMLIHGLADDNVVAAHTLRLSAGAAGGWTTAYGAADVRRYAPGLTRGRRGEPAAPAARVPA